MSKKTKMTQVPLFINKIYEMIDVNLHSCRIKITLKSLTGPPPKIPFRLKTFPSLRKRSYLTTSNIKILHPLSGSSTCMVSKKYGILKGKMYIWTKISKRERNTYSKTSIEKLKRRRSSRCSCIVEPALAVVRWLWASKSKSSKTIRGISNKCVSILWIKTNVCLNKIRI